MLLLMAWNLTRGFNMWETKLFKTEQAFYRFIEKHERTHQIVVIYVNNGYGVEYKRLRRVY